MRRRRQRSLIDALRRLDDAGIVRARRRLRRPTLDDVFLTLTGHAAEEAEKKHRDREAATETPDDGSRSAPDER